MKNSLNCKKIFFKSNYDADAKKKSIKKRSYITIWLNMTLFTWLLMTALKVLFKLIILINQNDKCCGPACWKPGTKSELIRK